MNSQDIQQQKKQVMEKVGVPPLQTKIQEKSIKDGKAKPSLKKDGRTRRRRKDSDCDGCSRKRK